MMRAKYKRLTHMHDDIKYRPLRSRERISRAKSEEELIERGIDRLMRRQARRSRRDDR